MLHRKKTEAAKRRQQPDNLLDLNRSLPNYAYQPHTTDTEPIIELKERHFGWKKFFIALGVSLGVALLVVGGWLGWKLLHNELKIFGWKGIVSLVKPTKLKGEDQGHVTILLAGYSADDPGHSGGELTDSIMLLSLNTKTNTGFMLSIPRDLYVHIPGAGYGKINEVYEDGERLNFSEAGYPNGGMGLLEKVVSQDFGISIQYYGLVNYSAVRQAVDALGGVDVNIQSTDPRGVYDPSPDLSNNYKPLVDLRNGVHALNGTQALGLTRARGDSYGAYGYAQSDFTRTSYQRQVLLALKDKAFSVGILANPVKLGNLFDSVGGNVKTDVSLGGVGRLYTLTKNMPNSNITSASLNSANGVNLLTNYTTEAGQSALVPKAGPQTYDAIQAYVQTLYNPAQPSNTSTGSQKQ